jgi:hypothetical protein
VHTSHVVQVAIVALSHNWEKDVIDPNSWIFRGEITHQRVMHNSDAVRISQRDRRTKNTPLGDNAPRRKLTVTAERVTTSEQAVPKQIALVWNNHGDPGARQAVYPTFPHITPYGRVTDRNPINV